MPRTLEPLELGSRYPYPDALIHTWVGECWCGDVFSNCVWKFGHNPAEVRDASDNEEPYTVERLLSFPPPPGVPPPTRLWAERFIQSQANKDAALAADSFARIAGLTADLDRLEADVVSDDDRKSVIVALDGNNFFNRVEFALHYTSRDEPEDESIPYTFAEFLDVVRRSTAIASEDVENASLGIGPKGIPLSAKWNRDA